MWKKGMRLTDEILTLSDKCTEELVSKGLLLGSCGRMGLIPGTRKFNISLDINDDLIDVVSLDCFGVTRDGRLIDVRYDTGYTNSFDTRVAVSAYDRSSVLYLCVVSFDDFTDTNDGLCDTRYGFVLIEENTPVPDSALPIARIAYDEYCWRVDENSFVPPCLYVNSHVGYEELARIFVRNLREMNEGLPQRFYTQTKDAVKIFWPVVQEVMIVMDKELDTMTPMAFLGHIQKLVSSFYCACRLDEGIDLSEPEQYVSYINAPCNYRNVYELISKGVDLSYSINERIKMFDEVPVTHVENSVIPAPSIDSRKLRQKVEYGSVTIPVTNNAPGSTIHYTVDGSMPDPSSKSGNTIVIESGFSKDWHGEPPKKVTVKVIACKGGKCSETATFNVQIMKGKSSPDIQI